MKQYLQLVENIMNTGIPRPNRTGERAIGIFGAMLDINLDGGFPLLTTKQVPFKAVVGELVGFIQGATSAATFRELGCNVWNANANDPGKPGHENRWLTNPHRKGEDDLGRIYGAQWREWNKPAVFDHGMDYATGKPTYDEGEYRPGDTVDQLKNLMDGLRNDPFGRRHVVTAWNPGELNLMALPPCHMFFQVYVEADESGKPWGITLQMYQRSVDVFLGLPFNIASYALLAHMIAHCLDLKVHRLVMNLGDTHIYESHIPEMLVQLRRKPKPLPTLHFVVPNPEYDGAVQTGPSAFPDGENKYREPTDKKLRELWDFQPRSIQLHGYTPHSVLKGRMAV